MQQPRMSGMKMFAQVTVQKEWGQGAIATLVSIEHQGAGGQFWAYALLSMGAEIVYTTVGGPMAFNVSDHPAWAPVSLNQALMMQPAIPGPREGLAQLAIIITDKADLAAPDIITYATGTWPNAYNFAPVGPAEPEIRNLQAAWY